MHNINYARKHVQANSQQRQLVCNHQHKVNTYIDLINTRDIQHVCYVCKTEFHIEHCVMSVNVYTHLKVLNQCLQHQLYYTSIHMNTTLATTNTTKNI